MSLLPYSESFCPSSSSWEVSRLSTHCLLHLIPWASQASLSRWDLKATPCECCSHRHPRVPVPMTFSEPTANCWVWLPHSLSFIFLGKFIWVGWLAPWGKSSKLPRFGGGERGEKEKGHTVDYTEVSSHCDGWSVEQPGGPHCQA